MKKVFYEGNITPEQILNELFEFGPSREIEQQVLLYLEKLQEIRKNLTGHVALSISRNGSSMIKIECEVLRTSNSFVLVKTIKTQSGDSIDFTHCEQKIFFVTPAHILIGVEVLEKTSSPAPCLIDDGEC
jgi:hypothetical protein